MSDLVKRHQDYLHARIKHIDDVLPPFCQGHGERLYKRAMVSISRNADLMACTVESVWNCVIRAAEVGLAIDGVLAHAVPFNVNKGSKDKPEWKKEATLVIDYKGMVAIARRSQNIKDASAQLVYQGDEFSHSLVNGEWQIRHVQSSDPKRSEKAILGAYCLIVFPDGYWRAEWMDYAALMKVKATAKTKNVWDNNEGEMCRKTVIKRAMKLFLDVDSMLLLASYQDDDTDEIIEHSTTPPEEQPVGRIAPKQITNQTQVAAAFDKMQPKVKEPVKQESQPEPKQELPAVPEEEPQDVSHLQEVKEEPQPATNYAKWVTAYLDEIKNSPKASTTESIGNKLLTDFRNPETSEPDKIEHFPGLFAAFAKKLRSQAKDSDLPRLRTKLSGWSQYLDSIHAPMMKEMES